MPIINRSIDLNVPLEMAFRYLLDPAHLPEFCPTIDAVADIEHKTVCTNCFSWSCKMVGVHFEGRAEICDIQHDYQISIRFWGGLRGSLTWHLQRLGDGTQVEITLDYALPAPLLRKHAEAMVIDENERAVETLLTSLKALLELQVLAQTAD